MSLEMECSSGIWTGSKEKEQIMPCVYFKIFSEGWSMAYIHRRSIYIYKEKGKFIYTRIQTNTT